MLVYMNQALADKQQELKILNRMMRREDIVDAIIKGALLRIRPIMMTVVAIIAGLLPIMIGSGVGSEVMQRIAAPMIGGMVSATILTLLLLPAVFLIWKSFVISRTLNK